MQRFENLVISSDSFCRIHWWILTPASVCCNFILAKQGGLIMGKRFYLSAILISVPLIHLFGAAGRDSDGHLIFLVLLGLLAIILGVMYLVDYIKYLINRFLSHHNHKEGNGA